MFTLIKNLFDSYSSLYPEEVFPVLAEQLGKGDDITSRKNFTGHVIADGCVIDPKHKKILMIYHATHEQWFTPGGHIDPEDDHPASAARREVLEETGVKADLVLDEHKQPLLLHINSHIIPLNEKKEEPTHWHHGMTFLFLADSTLPLPDNKDEGIASCQWRDIEEVLQYELYQDMLSKIQLN